LKAGANLDNPISFLLFFFLIVPFVLANVTNYVMERRKADEDLRENNNPLKELLVKIDKS
jgi:hypothetical protein